MIKKFQAEDYLRMARELEQMADLIHLHPEKNHNTSERLRTLASEMREDAESAYLALGTIAVAAVSIL